MSTSNKNYQPNQVCLLCTAKKEVRGNTCIDCIDWITNLPSVNVDSEGELSELIKEKFNLDEKSYRTNLTLYRVFSYMKQLDGIE